jgi:hypothetical protein
LPAKYVPHNTGKCCMTQAKKILDFGFWILDSARLK